MKSLSTAGIFFHNQLLNPTGHYLSFSDLPSKFSVTTRPTTCLEYMMLINYMSDTRDNVWSHNFTSPYLLYSGEDLFIYLFI